MKELEVCLSGKMHETVRSTPPQNSYFSVHTTGCLSKHHSALDLRPRCRAQLRKPTPPCQADPGLTLEQMPLGHQAVSVAEDKALAGRGHRLREMPGSGLPPEVTAGG